MLKSQQKIALFQRVKQNPSLATLEMIQRAESMAIKMAEDTLARIMPSLREQMLRDLNTAYDEHLEASRVMQIKGDQGEEGIKGDQGDQGIQGDPGKDGRNGINGENGKDGENGLDGRNGINGKNGEKGMDGKNGSPDTPEEVVGKINTLTEVIDQKTIKGFSNFVKNIQNSLKEKRSNRMNHGGGISGVQAGTNITITSLGHGQYRIASTASGGGVIITTTDSGDHKSFTLFQAPTTSNYYIILNNGIYFSDDAAFGFSIVSTTLTFVTTLPTDITALIGADSTKLKLVCI